MCILIMFLLSYCGGEMIDKILLILGNDRGSVMYIFIPVLTVLYSNLIRFCVLTKKRFSWLFLGYNMKDLMLIVID